MRTDFGGGSVQSRLLALTLRHTAKRVITAWSMAPLLPWPYGLVDQAGRTQRVVDGTQISWVRLPSCRAQVISTPASRQDRHVLYFHGGAFLVGGGHLHHGLISRIADATGATVLAPAYRKLPNHPVHVSVQDSLSAYRHLLREGVDPSNIVFMGDSAGGFLSLVVADAAREAGLPLPAGIVAMSPLLDLDLRRSPLYKKFWGCDLFNARAIPNFSRLAYRVARGAGVHSAPDCQLVGLPPVLLQVSSAESLYAQSVVHAESLQQAGVDVRLQVWDGQVHVFQAARPLPEAQEAVGQVAAFVEEVLSPQAQTA